MNILECNGLSKAYTNGRFVLRDLNLEIPEGRIVGLLGPNGCGKSTLIKMVAGVLQPTSGEIKVAGLPVGDQSKALVSYLPERTYFNSWMSVCELIDFFSQFYADFEAAKAHRLLADLSINPNQKLKTMSKGTKEKVQLILVMSRNARLYLLDEPIAGVDPAAREYILGTIVGNYNPDATIIITTHLIADIEQVLDEFMFLSYGGQILKSGSVDEARAESNMTLDAMFKEVFRCSQNY